MFNSLSIKPHTHKYYRNDPDLLFVSEWCVTVGEKGDVYVTNEDMKYYECRNVAGERIISSDSLDGIISYLLEVTDLSEFKPRS